MNQNFKSLLTKFDVDHLKFILQCFGQKTSGNKEELIKKILEGNFFGIEHLLFYKWDKYQLQTIATKLGLDYYGTKYEIEEQILNYLSLGDQYLTDHDMWHFNSEGLIQLIRIDLKYILDKFLNLGDLKELCDDLGLSISGSKMVLINRLNDSKKIKVKDILEDLDEEDIEKLAEELDIDDSIENTSELIHEITKKINSRSSPSSLNKKEMNTISNYKFDIAISYAGEQRVIAEKIAAALKKGNIKVFFDKYEKANLWGLDLATHLQKIYSEQAKFCIMLISNDYKEKAWTNHERAAAIERYINDKGDYILPILIDNDAWVDGISKTISYFKWDEISPEEILDAVRSKLK
ncbi:TIR domain-containing protein [Leptospira alstonii]|uniref:TIR domain-containing protein n=1 Tax=Leptospira alstonii TaxID=28452 RepID=UPI000773D16F|nr:TIR domain-containing protein [Leptospira alstonii]